MNAGVKIFLAALLLASAIGYLAFLGAASSWKYYLSVDEAVAQGLQLKGSRIRVSGRVEVGSLAMAKDRRQAGFDLVGNSHKLHAECHCSLPDNLAENIDVVVEGRFEDGCIVGHKVITRCASKYKQKDMAVPFHSAVDQISLNNSAKASIR
jgi:cytochrome c-type biogenesis protein CcmE